MSSAFAPTDAAMNRVAWPGRDSWWWLVVAGAAFTAAQLAFVSPRMGLSWDETVYVSQVSGHAPAAYFDPARARGVPLLVAPVTELTHSVAALRVYLAIASGAGLTAALWVWRRLRPAWVLGLAAVLFGGLWVAQYYGPQAMPDMWSALGGLVAVGCCLRWRLGLGSSRWALAGLGASVAFMTLVRPGDAVYLAIALLVVAGAYWWQNRARAWPGPAVIVGGLIAGGAEWVIEAGMRFGGIGARLQAAGAEQGGFGLHFALLDELRALNGPTLCRPCSMAVRDPGLDLWWLVLPALVGLGLLAAWRAGRNAGGAGRSAGGGRAALARVPRLSVVLPAVCGLVLAAQYLFMINYAAPRFLLPAYALLAIPAADGVAYLLGAFGPEMRPAMTAIVTSVLIVQLLTQHLVLDHEASGTVTFHDDYRRVAAELAAHGVRPPCLITGVQYIPIAWYAGCASNPPATPGDAEAVIVQTIGQPPAYAKKWRVYRITSTRILKVNAFIRGR
jgi:hypothetical protein